MTRTPLTVALGALLLALAACEPSLDQRLDAIDAPRLIAVISEPAEVPPEDTATHLAIVATPGGEVAAAIEWAFCVEPKPPTEDNVVNAACLGADAVVALPPGPTTTAVMPVDACQRFGPDTPPGGYRPRDPDITGGYYQPLRVTLPGDLGGAVAFASHRIACLLGNAPAQVALEFRDRYTRNVNPPPAELARADGGDLAAPVARGAELELIASWPAAAAEPYVSYDQPTASLRDRREGMRATWYITGGTLATDANGVTEDAPGTSVGNTWTAPDTAGTVSLWIVLRDSRGGSSSRLVTLTIQ